MDKIFIMVTDDDIDHMLYSKTRDEIKRCNAEILRLRKLLAAEPLRAADVASCSCQLPPSAIPQCGRCGKPFKSQRT